MISEDCDPEFKEDNALGDDFDPLFGDVVPGQQADGALIVDLGWAGMGLLETLGIESLIGVQGFENADAYYRWMQGASGSPLPDWYGVQLRLYECWYMEPVEGTFCYGSWREKFDSEALCCRPVDVYCLRHISWTQGGRRRLFNCSRTRSYCVAAHTKKNPDVPVSPEIMSDVQGDGLLLTGIRPGAQKETVLDWPTCDLGAALSIASSARNSGVGAIHLWENGIGVALDELSDSDINRLLKFDSHYGGEMPLCDLGSESGVIH